MKEASIRTLEQEKIEILHQAFLKAFSDYQVNLDMPLIKFQNMLQRRGYLSEISVGTYKNAELVGFILNGFREWNGKPTAYDTGTGVIMKYRRQGFTTDMFQNIKELLKKNHIKQYLLEVIQSNAPAVQLYSNLGFEVIRTLSCFQLVKSKYTSMTNYETEHLDRISSKDWDQLVSFWDVQPSWQNSIDSINAVSNSFLYSIVRNNNSIIAYGIIDKKTGDIPQFAVDKFYRHKGIGRSIFTDLLNNTESQKIAVINVDTQSNNIKDFLLELGFEYSVSQYEMLLKL